MGLSVSGREITQWDKEKKIWTVSNEWLANTSKILLFFVLWQLIIKTSNLKKEILTTISDPLDVSLTADGDLSRETAAVAVVVPGWSGLAVFIPPRATTSSTSPLACCRILMACWWEMLLSRGWPSIARIWSPSWRRPSLKHKRKKSH